MRGRALSILLLFLCLYFALGFPSATAQPRSEYEVIIGTSMNDLAMDMVIDSTGSVIVVGRSQISLDPSSGKFYAVKVSSSGEVLWTKSWNISSSDMLVGVTVDSADNILVTGAFNLTTDQVYGIIYKLDPDGENIWSVAIDNLNFVWWPFGGIEYCLDIEMHPESDDFFIVGSETEESHRTFIARYNTSGSLVWYTDWQGPSESLGSIASHMWLSSQNWIIVSGLLYSSLDSYDQFGGSFLAAFDFDGHQVWNFTSYEAPVPRESSAGFEFGPDEFIYATYAGRKIDHIVCCTYNLNATWSFDMIIDDLHSVAVTGFLANGTDNLIGYGEVTSLIAGRAVTKNFQPAYSGFQPPQTLIFSFSSDGELTWYDFLVIGRISDPCGCQFDSGRRLIVAGHTSVWDFDTNDFYIVFGFVQTPFPPFSDSLAIFIFPIFNLLALCSIWIFERIRSRRVSPQLASSPRVILRRVVEVLLIIEVLLYAFLYQYLIGSYVGGGPPPPLVYYPDWVAYFLSGLFYGLLITAFAYLAIWYKNSRIKS